MNLHNWEFPLTQAINLPSNIARLIFISSGSHFFSLGKRWVIRKGDKMYVMADAFKPIVEQIPNKKGTPWYTFTGLLLGLAAIIFFSI